ncbi:MAG: hypothetical protein QW618_03870 [Nitrososphaerales archaeon]
MKRIAPRVFEVDSESGNTYIVWVDENGWGCTCMRGFIKRSKGEKVDCKHVIEVISNYSRCLDELKGY